MEGRGRDERGRGKMGGRDKDESGGDGKERWGVEKKRKETREERRKMEGNGGGGDRLEERKK